jgi:hypothetical protein
MNTMRITSNVAFAALLSVAAGAVASGCASTSGSARAERLSDGIQDTIDAVDSYGALRRASFDSMGALAAAPPVDREFRFDDFDVTVDKVVAADVTLRKSVASMRLAADARFRAWGEANVSYADPAMQLESQKSRAEAMATFETGVQDADAMLSHSAGFVTYLSDLRRILSNDLTATGVENVSDFADRARNSSARLDELAAAVRSSLGAATEAMRNDVSSR